MANQPAQTEQEVKPELTLEGLEEGSPQYKHTLKLIKEEQRRKKAVVVVDEWTEIHVDNKNKFGGKCFLLKRMAHPDPKLAKKKFPGSVHRLYLGRYKKGGKESLEAYDKKGIKLRQPKMEI